MKQYLSLIAIIWLITSALFGQTIAQPPANFTEVDAGTPGNPYQIATLANLRWLSETPAVWGTSEDDNYYFIQTADIDMAETQNWNNGRGFSPIGNHYENHFYSYYDGGNFLLSNMYIHRNNSSYPDNHLGLFGELRSTIENIRISGTVTVDNGSDFIAILAGNTVAATIRNCEVEGSVYAGGGGFVGLVVGAASLGAPYSEGTFVNCRARGEITIDSAGSTYAGLLAGLGGERIVNCSVEGNLTINGNGDYGMIGLLCATGVSIEKCSAQGNIYVNTTSEHLLVGGLVGFMSSDSILKNSFYKGSISAQTGGAVGGLVGRAESNVWGGNVEISHNYITSSSPLINVNKLVGSAGLQSESTIDGGHFRDICLSITNNFWNESTGITNVGVDSLDYNNNETYTTEYTTEGLNVADNFGLSDTEMKQAYNYINNDWDFVNIWGIDPDINDGYPFITEQSQSENEVVISSSKSVLIGNYPNPFNPETTILFNNAKAGNVQVCVYNIRGQKVRTLVDEHYGIGEHKVVWNGVDDNGRSVASGVYFYRMAAGAYVETKRMLMLK